MLSFLFILSVLYLLYLFLFHAKAKTYFNPEPNKELTTEEKQLYLDLHKILPDDYILSYNTQSISLRKIYKKQKEYRKQYNILIKKFNNGLLDFVVLNRDLEICCLIYVSKRPAMILNEINVLSKSIGIPVFNITNSESPICNDMVKFLS